MLVASKLWLVECNNLEPSGFGDFVLGCPRVVFAQIVGEDSAREFGFLVTSVKQSGAP